MQEEQAVAGWLPIFRDFLDAQDAVLSTLLGAPVGNPAAMPVASLGVITVTNLR